MPLRRPPALVVTATTGVVRWRINWYNGSITDELLSLQQTERHHEAQVVRHLFSLGRQGLDRRGTLGRLEREAYRVARHVPEHLEYVRGVEPDVERLARVVDLELLLRLAEVRRLHGEPDQTRPEREADPVRLLTGDHRHAAQRLGERGLVRDRDLVVVPRDDLLVVRVRPLDQTGEDVRAALAEAEVVLAPGHLDLRGLAEEPLHLRHRLGRDDQVRGGRRRAR